MCIYFKPPSLSDPRLPIQAKPKRFHGNTMKLFCQLANDDFMALWITALYYSALLYTHSTIEQIAQKCRMTTKKTGNASKYALSKEIFSSLKLQTSSGEGGTPHAMQETQIFKSLGFFL